MRSTSAKNLPLTLDQVHQLAPSVFATQAWNGVSEKYQFIPTITIVESLLTEGWQIMKAVQSTTRIEGKQEFTKHLLRFRRPGMDLMVGDVFPEIVMVNSHDRGSAYQLHAGLYRLACSNGLVVDDCQFSRLSIRHSGRGIIDEIRFGADEIVRAIPEITREVQIMKAIELTPDEKGIFARAAMPLKFEENSPVKPKQLLRVHRNEDKENDIWSTYNVIQENMIKGGLRYETPPRRDDETGRYIPARRQRTREIKGISEDMKLNKSLFTLANEMKRLKMAQ